MVAERAIVGVLLYCHDLYGIIAVFGHAGKHILAELLVSADALGLLRHADVALIDEQGSGVGLEAFVVPCEGALGCMHLCREDMCVGVLLYACGVGRYAFAASAGPLYEHFIELTVGDGVGSESALPYARQPSAGTAKTVFRQGFPTREIADEGDCRGIGSPFAEYPRAVFLAVEAEIFMSVGEVAQRPRGGSQVFEFTQGILMTTFDSGSVRSEPLIVFQDIQKFHSFGE